MQLRTKREKKMKRNEIKRKQEKIKFIMGIRQISHHELCEFAPERWNRASSRHWSQLTTFYITDNGNYFLNLISSDSFWSTARKLIEPEF